MGFEPTIPVFERAKTVHALLDRAATVIGLPAALHPHVPRFKCQGVSFRKKHNDRPC
jgi:hypothetical protein